MNRRRFLSAVACLPGMAWVMPKEVQANNPNGLPLARAQYAKRGVGISYPPFFMYGADQEWDVYRLSDAIDRLLPKMEIVRRKGFHQLVQREDGTYFWNLREYSADHPGDVSKMFASVRVWVNKEDGVSIACVNPFVDGKIQPWIRAHGLCYYGEVDFIYVDHMTYFMPTEKSLVAKCEIPSRTAVWKNQVELQEKLNQARKEECILRLTQG